MRDEMEEAGLSEPVFSTEGGFFTVTFKRPYNENGIVNSEDGIVNSDDGIVNLEDGIVNSEDGIVNSDDDIVNFDDDIVNDNKITKDTVFEIITNDEGLSAFEIAKRIGKSWRTTMRYLEVLRKENKIEFRGAPKTGGYYAKNEI